MDNCDKLSERFREIENKKGLLVLIEANAGYYNIKRDRNVDADSTSRTFMSLMAAIANIVASICIARACLKNLGLKNAADVLTAVALIVILEWFAVAIWILGMEYDDIVREKESRNQTNQGTNKQNNKSGVKLEEIN